MMNEDYCDFETAKLLKEKGFYQDFFSNTIPVWKLNGNNPELVFSGDDGYPCVWEEWYSAPTLAAAMKWLREARNRFIEVDTDKAHNFQDIVFRPAIYDKELDCLWESDNFPTYEEACEAAIKYCTENLI